MLLNILGGSIRRQWELIIEQAETDRKILDIVEKVSDSVHTIAKGLQATSDAVASTQRLQAEIDKSKQGVRGKLRTAIKSLFGG